ncbi:DUF6233 domain-containing protein [Streptomyces bungoensis]|uniref:DUF6233 domain-containing protein n=1 Tax=Streptomyces bungoensis TaxID=285568 RepID=UPI0036808F26
MREGAQGLDIGDLLGRRLFDHARRLRVAKRTCKDPLQLLYKPSRHLAAHGRQQGEERRPPQPDWLIQHGLNRSNIDAVHTGDCWAAARRGRCRPATREQALDALQRQIPTCTHCRPGTALGILDLSHRSQR